MAKQRIIPIIYKVDYKQVDQSTASVKKAEDATNKFNKQVQQTEPISKKAFNGLKNAIVASGIIALVGTLTKRIFDLGIANEQTAIAFNTLTGSVAKGTQLLKELTKFSIETPFTPEQVNKAAKSLLAFGVEAKKIIPTLKLIGDVASGTGKDLAEMAVIFGQIRSTGRLMGQDLLQLINAGFNPLQIISQKTGKSVALLKQEMEKGLISFQMVEDAFKSATSEGGLFFNLMEKQSVSLGGKLSTLEGNFEELGKEIFKMGTGPVPFLVDRFGNLIEVITKFIRSGTDISSVADIHLDKFRKKFVEVDEAVQKGQKNATELQNIFAADLVEAINQVTEERAALQGQMESGILTQDQANLRDRVLRLELDTYRQLLTDTIALKKEDIVQTQKQTKEDKEREKALKLLNEQLGFKTAATKVTERQKEAEELQKIEDAANERSLKNQEFFDDLRRQKLQEQKDFEYEILESDAERRKELDEKLFEFGLNSLETLLELSLLSRQQDFDDIKAKFDQELELAGNNERAKEEILNRQEKAEKKFRDRQRQAEKENARKRIGIDTAVAIIKTFAQYGYPAGIPFAALMLATGVLQTAMVNKFKDGVIDLQGAGTGTSDSIPSMLSRGESVMTARETDNSMGILKAIRAKKLDDKVLEKLYKKAGSGGDGVAFTDERIVNALKNQPRTDFAKIGSYIYEVRTKNSKSREFIRKKYMG